MSQMKRFDKSLYPCIQDAIFKIMDKHLLIVADNPIYSAGALNELCFFLAENNIKHQYTIIPAPASAECDEIISLMWVDGPSYGNAVWYSRGETCTKKLCKLTVVVAADDVEDIESWLSDAEANDIELIDWKREEMVS